MPLDTRSDVTTTPLPAAATSSFATRLAAVGAVVFVANAGLLVLQLVAGRLLSPFIGSSLETWTAVIAAFLAGIAVGNAVGGRLADRAGWGGRLAVYLLVGAAAAGWMAVLPWLLNGTSWHAALPLGPRIPVLAFALCFPVAFALSLLTPVAIRLGVPDVRRTGLVSGVVFGLSTLGCVLGNYVTGFVLIPALAVDHIVFGVAGVLAVTAAVTLGWKATPRSAPAVGRNEPTTNAAALTMPVACLVVFLCSFAGMTLELSATRLLAPVFGVSIFTWTGVIGVMLVGTCLGNWLGGWLADRGGAARTPAARKLAAAGFMLAAGVLAVGVPVLFAQLQKWGAFTPFGLVGQIVAWTFALFFLPMLALGTISPQVIRLAVPDVAHAGRTAGRVYAWSTAGAIAGTFATGYVLISSVGVLVTLLAAAVLPCVAAVLVADPRKHPNMLYAVSGVAGALLGGGIIATGVDLAALKTEWRVKFATVRPDAESNYYTITVSGEEKHTEDQQPLAAVVGPASVRPRALRVMNLDHLTHSIADLNDPTFLHYPHERIQLEAVYAARHAHPAEQRVLVIGGGGYTFPRCAKTLLPTAAIDVVEIDPAVTAVAESRMGFDPKLAVAHHMDGRQFVAERAESGAYHVVTLDAVNDYSVPYHLLTHESHEAVKRTLTADGVYLVTVIDEVAHGKLWKATYHTLAKSFPHVRVVFPPSLFDPADPTKLERSVIVLYASATPFENTQTAAAARHPLAPTLAEAVPDATVRAMLATEPPLVLTDQFAPVDNLMMQVFRNQWQK
jgi:spermidine synthase/MFS family permease